MEGKTAEGDAMVLEGSEEGRGEMQT